MTTDFRPPGLTSRHALFLDFDGTLAPIQDDPASVALPGDGDILLTELSGKLDNALAVLSGRDIRDLSLRVPASLWRAGGHGLETCAPNEAPADHPPRGPDSLGLLVQHAVTDLDGVWAEPKGAIFAIHYRAAPEHRSRLGDRLADIVEALDGYVLQQGKMVFELKPETAHKGRALEQFMHKPPFEGRQPIMVGDDTTDEDAMGVALALGGIAIKVGAGDSQAPYRLGSPEEVWTWLRSKTL